MTTQLTPEPSPSWSELGQHRALAKRRTATLRKAQAAFEAEQRTFGADLDHRAEIVLSVCRKMRVDAAEIPGLRWANWLFTPRSSPHCDTQDGTIVVYTSRTVAAVPAKFLAGSDRDVASTTRRVIRRWVFDQAVAEGQSGRSELVALRKQQADLANRIDRIENGGDFASRYAAIQRKRTAAGR